MSIYYKKYLKYKVKFLNLQKQIAGSSPLLIPLSDEIISLADEVFNDTKFILISQPKDLEEPRDQLLDRLIQIFESNQIDYIPIPNFFFFQDWFKINRNLSGSEYKINILLEPRASSKFLFNRNLATITEKIKSTYTDSNINYITTNVNTSGKGGNYLAIPKLSLYFTLSDNLESASCKYIRGLICLDKYSNIDGHIDEILCFMPYPDNMYKLWLYTPIFTDDISEELKTKILENHNNNKEKITEIISSDNIIEFPLLFNSLGMINDPPLFNRICIKKKNKFIFIFPSQNDRIKEKIMEQFEIIKSGYPESIIEFVDSTVTHNDNGIPGNIIGGNLHCLTKQFV